MNFEMVKRITEVTGEWVKVHVYVLLNYIVHSDRFTCITKIMMALLDGIEQISGRVQFQTHVLTTPIISKQKNQINNRFFYSDKWKKKKKNIQIMIIIIIEIHVPRFAWQISNDFAETEYFIDGMKEKKKTIAFFVLLSLSIFIVDCGLLLLIWICKCCNVTMSMIMRSEHKILRKKNHSE